MIFENIDKYLEELDLHKRLLDAEKKLEETQQENKRLTDENAKLGAQVNTRTTFHKIEEKNARKLDTYQQNLAASQRNFIRSLDGSAARDMIAQWMKDFNKAPDFFNNWVNNEKSNYLNSVIDHPNTWSNDFRKRVEAALKKIQSSS